MDPERANAAGIVCWETLRELLNSVAHACARRYAGCSVVMLSADEVMFLEPVRAGDALRLLAMVNYADGPSMEIGIRGEIDGSGHVNSSFFSMQAVDARCRPVPLPRLQPRTPEARRRHDRAVLRRQRKEEFAQQLRRLIEV